MNTTPDKQLIVIAGPNGVGKTTFALEYLSCHRAEYLGADAFAERLAPGSPETAQIKAGREFLLAVRKALRDAHSLVIESTLSGQGFHRIFDQAKRHGFSVSIVFLFLESAAACVARVLERRRKGGHAVPPDDVRRRFRRSLVNFWQRYRFLVDDWTVVYNANGVAHDIASGSGERVMIHDEFSFALFIKLAEGKN